MNGFGYSSPALQKALAEKLRDFLRGVSWLRGWVVERHPSLRDGGFDLRARLPIAGGKVVELWVQCKSDPRPSLFPYRFVASEAEALPVLIFAAPYISPKMAQTCEDHGWSWFDLAGNVHLDVPGALRFERQGHGPVHKLARPGANLSTPESARVIRALLAPENAGKSWVQREMRIHCQPNVSLGLVNKVVRHLRDEAFIEIREDGFRVRQPLNLLLAWRDAYRFDRHQQRRFFTLKKGPELVEALASLESILRGHAAYASFSAADFQAPYVRQPRTWLFVGAEWEDEFASAVRAKPVDSGENLMLLIPNDLGVFYLPESDGIHLVRTNPVQTYVDLWHCGGRGKEAAEALLEQKLKPAWRPREPL